jgi:adenosylhomocysteine nucleosidase
MKRHWPAIVFCLALAFSLASCRKAPGTQTPAAASSAPAPEAVSVPPLAVLGAFQQEVMLLKDLLADVESRPIEGIEFISGRIGGEPVVLAWTGVGKVNAAMTTTLLLEHFQPRHVIFTGIAGGVDPNLEPGDIVIARQTAYHDMGTLWPQGLEYGGVKSRMTNEPNPVFFAADPMLLAVAQQAAHSVAFSAIDLRKGERPPRVVVGTVVTGDVFVAAEKKAAELAESLGARAVEMEGAAVAQVCYQREVGCLVIRSISDKADNSAVMDKQLFYTRAAQNSARLVVEMVRELTKGPNAK